MDKEIFRSLDLLVQLFQFSFEGFQVFAPALFLLDTADLLVHLFQDFMERSKEGMDRCGKIALSNVDFVYFPLGQVLTCRCIIVS